jgi:hypothetical protein
VKQSRRTTLLAGDRPLRALAAGHHFPYKWEDYRTKFVKVLPVEYKKALQEMKLQELDRKLYDIRLREDIAERV